MCVAGQDLRHRLCPSGALHIKAFVGLGWAHGTALKSPEPKHPTWDETLQQQAQPCSLASGCAHAWTQHPSLPQPHSDLLDVQGYFRSLLEKGYAHLHLPLLPENKPSLTHHTYFYGTQAVVC